MNEKMLKLALDAINESRALNFVVVNECEVAQRENERYALWFNEAYLLNESTIDEDGNVLRFEPVIIDGKAFFRAPDEGKSGILHFQHWTRRRGKPHETTLVSWLPCRWIRKSELALTNEQIHQNIVEEVIRGETPLTGLDNGAR